MNKKAAFFVLTVACMLLQPWLRAQRAGQDVVFGSGETRVTTEATGTNKVKLTIQTGQVKLRYDGQSQAYLAGISKGVRILKKGAPDIQKLTYAVQVPTGKGATAQVISADVETYEHYDIAPSIGNITRDRLPSTIVREKGAEYQQDNFYPATTVSLGTVYQVRDAYGQAISIVPMQYNPVTKTLKVYRNIVVEVTYKDRVQKKSAENAEWESILNNHFINYDNAATASKTRFAPVGTGGSLLIVTKAKYVTELAAFVKWKKQKGIRTYILNVDTLTGGASAANIKTYIKNHYQALDLSYVLLIGDDSDIGPVQSGTEFAGSSDAAYTYVAGNDHYPDLMIGRFSAETVAELQVQLERTIAYEKTPLSTSAWFNQAIGVASNEGPGDDNEFDWEHMRNIRTKLMTAAGGYTQVAELYDGTHNGEDASGNPNATAMKTGLNNGATLVNYCGHGSSDYLVTTGFSNQDVPQLTNDNGNWPFFWGVACVSGDFESQTCLGEKLLRQRRTSSNKPSGAIGAFFSTINQYWDPPMRAQDAYVDLMVSSPAVQNTLGTLTTTGTMDMNDAYDFAGFDMTDTWVLFGDPTVKLHTYKMDSMIVSHVATVNKNATQVTLNINVPGAKAVLYYQDSILSVATSAAGTSSHTFLPVTVLDSIWVTVTADFHKPYTGYIKVVGTSGIEEQERNNNALSIFPNPAADRLSLKGLTETCRYRCYNAAGALVRDGSVTPAQNTINVSGLAAGQYFLKAEGKNTSKSVPFQVVK